MKIISIRNGFTADHSSTSYEFLALDRALDAEARADVAKLSRRAEPTERQVSFIYNAEGYDLPGGWEMLRGTFPAHWDLPESVFTSPVIYLYDLAG